MIAMGTGNLSRNTYSDRAAHGDGVPAAATRVSDAAWLDAILEFERALATAAADVSVIDADARAAAISVIDAVELDLDAVSAASAAGANPAIPIVAQLKKQAEDQGVSTAGIHLGATSQDAIDTAMVLCLRRAASHTLSRTTEIERILRMMAVTHRATPIMGRTLGQQALPTTFGLVAATWLQIGSAARAAFEDAVDALPLQYAGATGTLAATHPHGLRIHDRLAELLELETWPLAWHSDRQPLVAVASAAARLAGAARKVAGDVIFYSATEVGEVREGAPGGSSSMPHKANPAAAIACDGYARRTPALAATMFDSLDCRLQRGTGSWHAEWQTMRELIAATDSAIARIHVSLAGLIVDADAMAAKLPDNPDVGHAAALVDDILERTADL